MNLVKYYYITCATGIEYIRQYSQFAVKSLLYSGISPLDIHVCVRTKEERKEFKKLISKKINFHIVCEDLSRVRWTYFGGLRKYSVFKIGALVKVFPKPIPGKSLVYFDGDVLFFKNPEPFFDTINSKTWFHHIKDYSFRATKDYGITEKEIDVKNYESLSKWVPPTMAHLLLKYGMSHFPRVHACAGLYVLHPRDHKLLLSKTYEFTWEIANLRKFDRDPTVGDQKPMNAVLNIFNVDWHGGHNGEMRDCKKYMDHYFGIKPMKDRFYKKIEELGI